MSPDGGGAVCDARPKPWPQPAPSANATRHRQQRRWRERSVATVRSSCRTSYGESAVRPAANEYERIALAINDIAIHIIVVVAMRHCAGILQENLRCTCC